MATKKIKTIREKLDGKMWKAVQAMVDGLKSQSQRKDFIVDMSTFGSYVGSTKLCYGCAATCSILQIAGKKFTGGYDLCSTKDRANRVGTFFDDLDNFEMAVNDFRLGQTHRLKKYLGIPAKVHVRLIKKLPQLKTENWQEGLPVYERYAELLKAQDI